MSGETIVLPGTLATAMVQFEAVPASHKSADLPEAGSAIIVNIIQVAIAVGSAVGGTDVDRAEVHADFTLRLGLALLCLVTLQRLAAAERPAWASSLKAPCDASPD